MDLDTGFHPYNGNVIQERKLESESIKLRAIFAQAPTPMAMLEGPEHRFTFANDTYRQYFLDGADPVGMRVADVFPSVKEQGFIGILDNVYQTGERFIGKEIAFEINTNAIPSRKFYLNFVYEPLRTISESVEGIIAVITDVTEQVQAREVQIQALKQADSAVRDLSVEKAKLFALVSDSASAIGLMRGPDLVFEVANKKWIGLVSPREYLGRRYVDIYPELVGTPAHKSLVDIFETGIPFVAKEMRLTVTSPSGKLEDQYFDYTNIRIMDAENKPYGVYCNAHNVSDRVLARMELEKAKLEAERANQIKSAFLANMSHEIRTPLSAILGFADLLKDSELALAERSQFLDTISRNGKALTRIIDDILDLAKVESGKVGDRRNRVFAD